MFVTSQPRGAAGLGSAAVPTLGEQETSSPHLCLLLPPAPQSSLQQASPSLRALPGTTEQQGHPRRCVPLASHGSSRGSSVQHHNPTRPSQSQQ